MKHYFFLLLFCGISVISFSQKITGKVLDNETNEPLLGVAIYYDNTSIGVTTDDNGEFSIIFKNLKTSLVFSYLGYQTEKIITYNPNESIEISLKRSNENLDEVVIYSKGWTREMMLKEFTKHYFGKTLNGKSCQLMNPEELKLRYDSKKKSLNAYSKSPLTFRNVRLKYLITVELEVFELYYKYVSKSLKTKTLDYVHYLGSNFYTSMQPNPTKETKKIRKETYRGSVLHFMRAIANKSLAKDGYSIFVAGVPVKAGRYINSYKDDFSEFIKVRLKMPLTIRYKNEFISQIKSFTEYFTIDSFGNHAPTDLVRFGGYLGGQRMGDTLPLDYLHKNRN
ncbi:carboxypeptidase-like protein [Lutibacter sp. Hel_I_33_5]|uniref:carboxypeptidase-like regulatory domain-containing protein n=1 Tax=Lutibacter sp. Hel_I_33_5 TaxID=1566289 RepID=UPI00119D1800|nr:carboxypeptidase-like regulatory domain-containing protein [Lutibacter sp. Hel_I_33_5]TVZ56356.1 carboxypeptidase-like protein [Lutibacter sp. Hel_I_33_5]